MGLMQNLKAAIKTRTAEQREHEYLEKSTSLLDLEMRQREIDRGRFRPRWTLY